MRFDTVPPWLEPAEGVESAGDPFAADLLRYDDTLLVVVSEKVGGERVARRLHTLCGL